jgi:hypothetical protein
MYIYKNTNDKIQQNEIEVALFGIHQLLNFVRETDSSKIFEVFQKNYKAICFL